MATAPVANVSRNPHRNAAETITNRNRMKKGLAGPAVSAVSAAAHAISIPHKHRARFFQSSCG
jgi:hypothetical protein